MENKGVYSVFTEVCKKKGTTLSRVLSECGCSTGLTGNWKAGHYPRLDIVMKIAKHLDVSLDELCYGIENANTVNIDDNQREWLFIIDNIPSNKQQMCKDFLRTHAMIPERYSSKNIIS